MNRNVFIGGQVLSIVALALLVATGASANSNTVSYQGVLRDAAQAPVADDSYDMRFSIWDDATGGAKRWGDENQSVTTRNGLFSVNLGSVVSLGAVFANYAALWLQIEVDLDGGAGLEVYNPRVPLASVPYAQQALNAANATNAVNADTVDNAHAADLRTPAGGIIAFGGATAPPGWLLCDGSPVSRATYSALFATIGSAYGNGDGVNTFNLPNLKTRVAVGREAGDPNFGALGVTGGARTHTLSVAEMPTHTHAQTAHTHAQTAHTHSFTATTVGWPMASGVARDWAGWNTGGNWVTQPALSATAATNQNTTAINQDAGGGGAHNNLQPYLVVNYIIKF